LSPQEFLQRDAATAWLTDLQMFAEQIFAEQMLAEMRKHPGGSGLHIALFSTVQPENSCSSAF
jgi:hypothetical protein